MKLDDWEIRIQFPVGTKHFSLLYSLQTNCLLFPVQLIPRALYRGYCSLGIKITTKRHLVPTLRMYGAMSLLSHSPYCVLLSSKTLPLAYCCYTGYLTLVAFGRAWLLERSEVQIFGWASIHTSEYWALRNDKTYHNFPFFVRFQGYQNGRLIDSWIT
jgi:hypothetical protein